MRTLTDGTLTVRAYDYLLYKQQRNVLRVKDTSSSNISLCWPNVNTTVATYTLDNNSEVVIDLSDFIRSKSGVQNMYVKSGTRIVNANFFAVGLINPKNVIIPFDPFRDHVCKVLEDVYQYEESYKDLRVYPPFVMLRGVGTESITTHMLYIPENVYQTNISVDVIDSNNEHCYQDGDIILTPGAVSYEILCYNYGLSYEIAKRQLAELACDKKYASVRWVDFMGLQRVHTFEVVKPKTETKDVIKLLTIDGTYSEIKGREDGFSLRLEGLNAYDYWYYSDVCHSSNVEVSFDGVNYETVEVATNDVNLPDGNAGKQNTIEIKVNWKQYDAVSM